MLASEQILPSDVQSHWVGHRDAILWTLFFATVYSKYCQQYRCSQLDFLQKLTAFSSLQMSHWELIVTCGGSRKVGKVVYEFIGYLLQIQMMSECVYFLFLDLIQLDWASLEHRVVLSNWNNVCFEQHGKAVSMAIQACPAFTQEQDIQCASAPLQAQQGNSRRPLLPPFDVNIDIIVTVYLNRQPFMYTVALLLKSTIKSQ